MGCGSSKSQVAPLEAAKPAAAPAPPAPDAAAARGRSHSHDSTASHASAAPAAGAASGGAASHSSGGDGTHRGSIVMSEQKRRVLETYDLNELLGTGGFGEVRVGTRKADGKK